MPVFSIPLTNIMARVGQKIKLECEITGTPRPQIHWTHNGKPLGGRDLKVRCATMHGTTKSKSAF